VHPFIKESRNYIDSFINQCCKTDKIPYIKKGILNLEAFYWWSLVGHYKPDIILESGVSSGRSSEVLSRAQIYFNVPYYYAFDVSSEHHESVRTKLQKYKCIYTIKNSIKGFTDVYNEHPTSSFLVIIDGPKSIGPLSKLLKTISKFDKVLAVGCHDCCENSEIRYLLSEKRKLYFPEKQLVFTSREMNKDISHLNNFIIEDISKRSMAKRDELLNLSNYIGMFLS
jgi:hypothetical protein